MLSVRVYLPNLRLGIACLSPEESHHLVDVLRLRLGDSVVAFDGAGCEGTATISGSKRGAVELDISNVVERAFDTSLRLTLAVAMGKVHRQGFLIEKCTELGVAAIWPMRAQRSVAIPKESATQKHRRRAIEAAKQSRRAWVPGIRAPQSFDEVIIQGSAFELAFIADTTAPALGLASAILNAPVDAKILTLVGPEGGWTTDERKKAEDAGFLRVSLSQTVLRTETAAVAVCAAIAMHEHSHDPTVSHTIPTCD